jgi:hypothetical protein
MATRTSAGFLRAPDRCSPPQLAARTARRGAHERPAPAGAGRPGRGRWRGSRVGAELRLGWHGKRKAGPWAVCSGRCPAHQARAMSVPMRARRSAVGNCSGRRSRPASSAAPASPRAQCTPTACRSTAAGEMGNRRPAGAVGGIERRGEPLRSSTVPRPAARPARLCRRGCTASARMRRPQRQFVGRAPARRTHC